MPRFCALVLLIAAAAVAGERTIDVKLTPGMRAQLRKADVVRLGEACGEDEDPHLVGWFVVVKLDKKSMKVREASMTERIAWTHDPDRTTVIAIRNCLATQKY